MQRYEVKFITNQEYYDQVMLWIKDSILSFRKTFANRIVNNIYFDDHDFTSFHENIIGMSKRNKIRYRWYGNLEDVTSGSLEIKHKDNNLGTKEIYNITNIEFDRESKWLHFTQSLEAQLPTKAKQYLLDTKPVLFNSYHRQYFESRNKKVRITIDQKQKFYKQRSSLKPNFHKSNLPLDILTIEIKAEKQYQNIVSALLKDIPIRQTKYSKFIVGMSE